MNFLPKFRGDFDLDLRSRARSRGRSGERLLGRRSPLVSILPMTLFHHHNYFLILVFEKKNKKSKPGLIKTFVLFSAFSSQHTQLKAENRNRLNPFLLFEVQIKKCYLNSTTKRKMYFIILGFCSSSVV